MTRRDEPLILHPVELVDHVIAEYRAHLRTEFRARDPGLRAALEDALDRPRFLAQEAFFQAHRPFVTGKPWTDLGLDPRLARVLASRTDTTSAFLHQSIAIEHLLGPDPSPLAVTTGTGSGKTECFLVPVLNNAIDDAGCFKKDGLTAILVYPMNALMQDQIERIQQYLEASGHGHVRVEKYDRTTTESARDAMRRSPPHILLTNYMMLEYLLVRPADREALFANHRCRYLVLDEVHTYRGSLGANIALLVRRLGSHLAAARQDWLADHADRSRRFPRLVPVATSATIKSLDETGLPAAEVARQRVAAVQEFLHHITGAPAEQIRVVSEELEPLDVPREARWTGESPALDVPTSNDAEAVRRAAALLAGLPPSTPLETSVRTARILWTLSDLLARRPRSVTQLADIIATTVPERSQSTIEALEREIRAALVVGAAVPARVAGGLRLRTHRFVRGGWRFHLCVDPACGSLHPMAETECGCGAPTAPLFICRGCGVHALGFRGDDPDPTASPLRSAGPRGEGEEEWLLFPGPAEEEDEDVVEEGDEPDRRGPASRRRSLSGSFDPRSLAFSRDERLHAVRGVLHPGRTRCLACGGTSGSWKILTPVQLGTSAAVRVLAEGLVDGLAEQHRRDRAHDGKERLLIFADSRQDASHQARFITYAGRFDRMRRRVVAALRSRGRALSIAQIVQELRAEGFRQRDNPHAPASGDPDFVPESVKLRASAWEEAPLLDDLAITARYRATVVNLGLVGVVYERLDEYVAARGTTLCQRLGLDARELCHLLRCLLDEMRTRGNLSRAMLAYHPDSPDCPDEFRAPADWQRKLRRPQGVALSAEGAVATAIDPSTLADGIDVMNPWSLNRRGRAPLLERRMRHLLDRTSGHSPAAEDMEAVLQFLLAGSYLTPVTLHGHRRTARLLHVEEEKVRLELLEPDHRFRCTTCAVKLSRSYAGAPCPVCAGRMEVWPDREVRENRYVQRILKSDMRPLVAREHTAQIPGEDRLESETAFKAKADVSPVNVLACSPTLEMGIDVGGLDAVVLRNVPPRPDNYAQRGGRAGRRTRVGVVVGFTRGTPHDQYFYDRPGEMIAGEVPAPSIGLGNRDVALRHLTAIALSSVEPGLAGRMMEYVNIRGERDAAKVQGLIDRIAGAFPVAARMALGSWGPEILEATGLTDEAAMLAALAAQPQRIEDLFQRVQRQIHELEGSIQRWLDLGYGDRSAVRAMDQKRKILGMPGEGRERSEADDRSSGNPMRRFAEHGILPGYEFPSQPATLRLLGDAREDEPLSVERRFGLAQYAPGAHVYARGHRWRVLGLDTASPWNPRSDQPDWLYVICSVCRLRYGDQDHARCPRCGSTSSSGMPCNAHEFAGFAARRDDTPVLEEEDRLAARNLLRAYPQWDGIPLSRFRLPTDWTLELSRDESVRWLNEWKPPSERATRNGVPQLHAEASGFLICPACGRTLQPPARESDSRAQRGRRRARSAADADPYGHARGCHRAGQPPVAVAMTTCTPAITLRVLVTLPPGMQDQDYVAWGQSLGAALRIGMRQLYMLDGPEIELELEPVWSPAGSGDGERRGSITFIDGAIGGSGFLERAAHELHLVAGRAIDHLRHEGCTRACYRCLKSYQNQRHHDALDWTLIHPDLEILAQAPPVEQRIAGQRVHDPAPWLEAFAAGVGSPLELQFLRLFEKHGLAVERQVALRASPSTEPLAIADFVVAGSRIAVFVDSATFHQGRRSRRDRNVRDRLRAGEPAWRIQELRAADLARGDELVAELRALADDRTAASGDDALERALATCGADARELVRAVAAMGLSLPHVGFELTGASGRVIGEAELAWPDNKLAWFTTSQAGYVEPFQAQGWTCHALGPVERDRDIVARALRRAEGE